MHVACSVRPLAGRVGGVTLPRAIGFASALYSIGVPPELLGLAALTDDDIAFVREHYPSFDGDLRASLRFANERHVRELMGYDYLRLLVRSPRSLTGCTRA